MKFIAFMICLFSLTAFADDGFGIIHSNELDTWMTKESKTVHVYDANNDKTRTKNGIIPGATTLASAHDYSVATLPANKSDKLVFYCANEGCMASHDAAKVAVKAGYAHVFVMADGIEGWKKAGKKTRTYNMKM